jgi:hypothetical protein
LPVGELQIGRFASRPERNQDLKKKSKKP